MIPKNSVENDSEAEVEVKRSKIQDFSPVEEKGDASFLAPKEYSFGLRQKPKGGAGFLRILVYVISVLIILIALVVIYITVFPPKAANLPQTANSSASAASGQQANQPAAANSSPNSYKVSIVGAPSGLLSFLDSTLQSVNSVQYVPDQPFRSGFDDGILAAAADTIYFKSSAQQQVNNLLGVLNSVGINPKIQQDDSIPDDFVIFLTANPVGLDLSADTAVVYNASGVSGAAKKYCAILQTYKVTGCNPQNATSRQLAT